MRRIVLAGLAGRTMIIGVALAAVLGGVAAAATAGGVTAATAGGVTAATAGGVTAGSRHAGAACARVSVTARPKLNTQAGSTETLRTTITSCASRLELVRVRQRLSLRGAFNGTVELYRHETVEITQNIPYHCCGTYSVTDRAYSEAGRLLSSAHASWTFA